MENQAKGQMRASPNSLPRWQKQLDVNCMCDTEKSQQSEKIMDFQFFLRCSHFLGEQKVMRIK